MRKPSSLEVLSMPSRVAVQQGVHEEDPQDAQTHMREDHPGNHQPERVSALWRRDSVWESAHRELRGKYRVNEERWAVMDGDYDEYEEKLDYFLVMPARARVYVLEFLDVKTLCRTEQVMSHVYALMAWFEALQGLESVALSA